MIKTYQIYLIYLQINIYQYFPNLKKNMKKIFNFFENKINNFMKILLIIIIV